MFRPARAATELLGCSEGRPLETISSTQSIILSEGFVLGHHFCEEYFPKYDTNKNRIICIQGQQIMKGKKI